MNRQATNQNVFPPPDHPHVRGSVVAYCTFGLVFGWTPLFTLPPAILDALSFDNPLQLASYTLLGMFVVALASA